MITKLYSYFVKLYVCTFIYKSTTLFCYFNVQKDLFHNFNYLHVSLVPLLHTFALIICQKPSKKLQSQKSLPAVQLNVLKTNKIATNTRHSFANQPKKVMDHTKNLQ